MLRPRKVRLAAVEAAKYESLPTEIGNLGRRAQQAMPLQGRHRLYSESQMRIAAILLVGCAIGFAQKPDTRLGAGGVPRSAGNAVKPGTPTRASIRGSQRPTLPVVQPLP